MKKISYQYPRRAIFHDKDGSLTGTANTYATPYYKHLDQPECTVDHDVYDGIYCNSDVQIRRVAFHGYEPFHTFRLMDLRIARFDDEFADEESKQTFLDDKDNHALIPFKLKQSPSNAHAIPFVTGHRYHIHWNRGLDFTRLLIEVSERWEENDLNTFFVTNYTDFREGMNITTNYGSGSQIMEGGLRLGDSSINTDIHDTNLECGENAFNGTYPTADYGREFNFVINGRGSADKRKLKIAGLRCIEGKCPVPKMDDGILLEPEYRLWNNPLSWEGDGIPEPGADVHIKPTWNMLLNVNDVMGLPDIGSLTINGRLTF
jgi:hypothetical protein